MPINPLLIGINPLLILINQRPNLHRLINPLLTLLVLLILLILLICQALGLMISSNFLLIPINLY